MDAGLDADLLYDLQAEEEWTWDKFVELAAVLSRDLDNDGVLDVYAINAMPSDFFRAAVLSNGAQFIDLIDGEFVNTSMNPETIEALQWATDFFAQPYSVYPSNWAGQDELFTGGKVAMTIGAGWKATAWAEMTDDWGFVAFPMGPQAEQYLFGEYNPIWVIPNSYTHEEAEAIALALDVYTDFAPGYDGPDDWMFSYYNRFRDSRAIEETLALSREPGALVTEYNMMMVDIDINGIAHPLYFNGATPVEALEGVQGAWNVVVDRFNGIE